jgi:hypothetical protein
LHGERNTAGVWVVFLKKKRGGKIIDGKIIKKSDETVETVDLRSIALLSPR